MDGTEREVSERVERATLPELESVDVEDVYVHMDYLLRSRPSPMDVYYRWESQQWSTRCLRSCTRPPTSPRGSSCRRSSSRMLEDACRTVASPDRRFAVSPALTPPNLLINPYDVAAFSTHSLTKRLRVAGVSAKVCDEITRRAARYYQAAWDEYEDLHGEEHPYRFFDRPPALST